MDLRYINPYYFNRNARINTRSNARTVVYEPLEAPIYDRTAEDVQKINNLIEKGYENFTEEEKTLWSNDLKGSLNASDLNRIEKNIGIIASALEETITIKKNWVITDIPYEEDFKRIHDNLVLIKSADIFISLSLPEVPELPYNEFEKINEIEKLIYQMYNILQGQFVCYCTDRPNYNTLNQLYSGEPIQ